MENLIITILIYMGLITVGIVITAILGGITGGIAWGIFRLVAKILGIKHLP